MTYHPDRLEHARSLAEQIVAWRRDFHMHPELGFREFRTASKVAETLNDLGILIGAQNTQPMRVGLLAAGFPQERLHLMATLTEAIAWYETQLRAGDAVLFLNDLPENWS